MHKLEDLREMLCEELDEITRRGEVKANNLDMIDKLTHSIKSIDTIIAMEDANRYSGVRKRDSMGRYSKDYYPHMRHYSYDDEKEHLRDQLEDMEHMATDEETRKMIHKWRMQV